MSDVLNIEGQYPFSPMYQRRILAGLLQDPVLYAKYYGIWNYRYFSDGIIQSIAQVYFDFRTVNKHNPDRETMINEVVLRNERSSEEFQLKLLQELEACYTHEVVDKEWMEKTVVDWAKNQAIESAVLQAAEELSKGKRGVIKKIIDEAVRVGEDIQNTGLFIHKGMSPISSVILTQRRGSIPTGFTDLDMLIGGGPGPGELFCFIGPPKGFKSGNMLNATMPALQAPYNKNVTYVSLELSEPKVLERYAYRITKMTKNQLEENPADFDKKFLELVEAKFGGKLAIKNYPVRTMTPTRLRAYLDLLDSKGHVTDLLVVDYGNIMKSEDQWASEWSAIGSNFEALRAVAIERDIPVISAARTNRESLQTENLQMHHIAGSMEIAATVDYGIAIIQTEQEHKDWTMRHKVLLNRNEEANIIIGNKIDYPTYSIWNTGIIESDEGEDDKPKKQFRKREEQAPAAPTVAKSTVSPELRAKLQSVLLKKT
jgi:hypothetical protein